MKLNYNQNMRADRVVTNYSRALGLTEAKQYIDNILNSALALAGKKSIPQDEAFSAVIEELKHYYRKNIVANDNSSDEARKVLVTLQDRLNVALGKKSKLK